MQRNPFSTAYPNAGYHNSIYRGKYLGNAVTAEQWTQIQNGTFEDLYIGDYWTINGVNWRIAHFDYWIRTGYTECTTHHVVIVPDTNLYNATMNDTAITTGGYYSSKMHGGNNYLVSGSSNLYQASEDIKSAFGSSHILTHSERLTNAVSGGKASGASWYNSSVDLMSELMVYGCTAWATSHHEIGIDKGQLMLFKYDITKMNVRDNTWLRGIGANDAFTRIGMTGEAEVSVATASRGVRPCFAIK